MLGQFLSSPLQGGIWVRSKLERKVKKNEVEEEKEGKEKENTNVKPIYTMEMA